MQEDQRQDPLQQMRTITVAVPTRRPPRIDTSAVSNPAPQAVYQTERLWQFYLHLPESETRCAVHGAAARGRDLLDW